MPTIETVVFPDLIFSTPGHASSTELNVSTNNYWQSNGFAVIGGVTANQVPHLDANVTGGQPQLLTSDTSSYVSANSAGFRTSLNAAYPANPPNLTIYSFAVKQDQAFTFPSFAGITTGEINLYFNVTMRASALPGASVQAAVRDDPNYQGTFNYLDPDQNPTLTTAWTTHSFNLLYATEGFNSWSIINGVVGGVFPNIQTALAANDLVFGLTLSNVWGAVEIAHVRMTSQMEYEVPTVISTGPVASRRAFGRPS